MNSRLRVRRAVLAGTAVVALGAGAAACSSNTKNASSSSGSTQSSAAASGSGSGSSSGSPMASQPFGPACSAVPKSGAGSFTGMAQGPVATAAADNPALSTLVAAVKKAGLVDTLNSAQNITVFAPDNAAFAKIPKATLDKVLNDKAELTKILTYHVVGKKLSPMDLAHGTYPTLEKSTLTTSGSGESYTVDNTAHVVCGNVQTANANVEIIDSVLMPMK